MTVDLKELARHETVLDGSARRVAGVYAEALFNAAEERKQTEDVLHDLEDFAQLLHKGDPLLSAAFNTAVLGRDRREAVLKSLEGKATELFVQFLHVLNRHERLQLLRPVAAAFRKLYDRKTGRMNVVVRSAQPLADDQVERLRADLTASFGRDPVFDRRLDPDLIGGMVVQVEDWVYDGSVRTRLAKIREQLVERGSHVPTH
jgi:F-type H+-transporting ATPase subunit delta